MCYIKLTWWFFAFCASVYFGGIEVEGFRFDDAKFEVRTFLEYLLPELNVFHADLSAIDEVESLEELVAVANEYLNTEVLNTFSTILQSNNEKVAEMMEMYMNYQTSFIELLEEQDFTRNEEIPLAYALAGSLCMPRPVFNLTEAQLRIGTLLLYLRSLVGYAYTNLIAINSAPNLEGHGYDPNVPQQMLEFFNSYRNTFIDLLTASPLTRGKEIPLADDIEVITSV